MKKRAVEYARLSDVRKGDTEGIERQLREADAHADRLEVEVVERLVDNDVTAAKKKPRAAFERLMTGIASNEWDVVILRSLDRWVRRPAELERIIEVVEKSNVRIEAIHGEIDLRTRQGRMAARILTSVAMHEVEAIEERVRDWHVDRAARGLPLHGQPGYGFRRPTGTDELIVEPDEAARIREAAARILNGETLRGIVRDWNEQGVPAPRDRWRPTTIRRIVMAPRTAGLREHNGEIVGPAVWPAILDKDTYERVVRYLNNPKRQSSIGSKAPKLLTGLATCGKCGKTLNHKWDHKGPRYFCRHCLGILVTSEHLDALVVAMVFDAVDRPALADTLRRAHGKADTASRIDEIASIEADLEALAHELGEGRLTMPEWKAARVGLERRLVALRAQAEREHAESTIGAWLGRGGALRDAWPDLTGPEQRAIVAALFESIEIRPARIGPNRFDPERVNPIWR